jgi:DNA-binding transcriptional MerR regulator
MTSTLRSGELAEAAGVNRQTLRYYERRGLLTAPSRTSGGHRLYPVAAVTLLQVIKTAQRLGFTLDEVSELVDLGRHRRGRRPAGLQARAAAKLSEIEARISDLQMIATTLRSAVDAGCDDLAECAASSCCPLPFADAHGRW